MLIAFLGFMVWAHHMFTVGLGPVANSIFAVGTMAIAVPTGIKIFNWILTMWGGQVTINSAMLWALGFIPSFTIGGMTGVKLGSAVADYQFHDTYLDRKSTRLNSSHVAISYAVFCLKKKRTK